MSYSNLTQKIRDKFNDLAASDLPLFTGKEEIDDIVEELILFDCHYAGLASSAASACRIFPKDLIEISLEKDIDRLNTKNLDEQARKTIIEIKERIELIKKTRTLLLCYVK